MFLEIKKLSGFLVLVSKFDSVLKQESEKTLTAYDKKTGEEIGFINYSIKGDSKGYFITPN